MSPKKAPTTQTLSEFAQLVAECYALVYPERPGRSKAMQWINRARKIISGKRGIKAAEMSDAINELVDADLLQDSIEGGRGILAQGPMAMPGTLTRFCESAYQRATATLILKELDDSSYRFSYRPPNALPDHLEQHIRLALIADRFEPFANRALPGHIWYWLTEPDAAPYLERLPNQHKEKACLFGLSYMVHFLQPVEMFAAICDTILPDNSHHGMLARAYVFQGNFKKAEALVEALEEDPSLSKQVRVDLQSIRALIATLQGDDAHAFAAIEKTIELERDGSRKRVLYPDTLCFGIAILSLVRMGTPEARALFQSLLASRAKLKIESDLDTLFFAAENAEKPRTQLGPLYLGGQATIINALFAIASRWHKDFACPDNHADALQGLQNLIRTAHAGGYNWLVFELLTVLNAYQSNHEQLAEDISILYKSQPLEVRKKSLGVQSLTQLVTTMQAWEHSLRELEQLTLTRKKSKANATVNTDQPTKRLVWQLSESYGGSVNVAPLEQSLGKDGKWTSGRRVGLKRLLEQSSNLPFLLEQDVRASATIQKLAAYGWGGGSPTYETNQRTAYQLIGHPHVYDQYWARIDVVDCPPALHLAEAKDNLHLSIKPERKGGNYQTALDEQNHRLHVTCYSAAHKRIADIIPTSGLTIPRDAKERLQSLLNSLAPDIAIQGDTGAASGTLSEGDTTPLLAIEPTGSSLRFRIRVEPLPDSGSFFDTGSGGAVVYVQSANGSVTVQRDLQQERARAHTLISQSSVLSALYDGRPHFIVDDTLQALELLEEVQANGIRCIWPGDIPFRIKSKADVSQVKLNIKSGKDWFAASGGLSLDDDTEISLESLLQLMSNQPQSRFVELGNGEFLSLSQTLKQQLDTLSAFSRPARGDAAVGHTHPMALLALDPLLDSASIKADKTWKQLRQRVTRTLTDKPAVPAALQADLRSYQTEGFEWMQRLGNLGAGACLADDMGLGKTVQALAVLLARADQGPTLVVAPTSVVGNWLQEAQRFAPSLAVTAYADSSNEREQILTELAAFDVVVISYGLLVNDIDHLAKVHWHTLVLDEAQAIKNSATRRAQCAKQLRADFRIVTTGTPVQNNLMDLHSLFGFLNPQLLGSEASFRQRFALPITRDNDQRAREQLQTLVSPFLLRRHKRDVLRELPARTEIKLDVSLSKEEALLYETIRLEALDSLENDRTEQSVDKQKFVILAYLTKLRRLCCNPKLIVPDWKGPMSKLDVFADTLSELIAGGHKALVFSQFVDHLKIVEEHLQKHAIRYQYIDGSVPAAQRTQRVTAFQSGIGDVFLISLTAGGTGLNLTAADYVIHLDPWWNPAVEDQASDRAHRLGQQRPVTIVRMVTTGTIEEQIQTLHGSKRDLADSVLAGAETPSLNAEAMLKLLQGSLE